MAAFRVLNQAPQYLLPNGQVNAGGKLYFYETDLTTPKDTWSDFDLTVLNSNPVLMDAAGRSVTDIWGDGEYGVVMTDADDVEIWTRNNVQADVGAGTAIPALVSGQFLTNDGSTLQWQAIAESLVPDPTGLNNYYLSSDGTQAVWVQLPEAEQPEIVVGTASFRAGTDADATKFLLQAGEGSMPASGTTGTTGSVVFPTAYGTVWRVMITASSGGVTPGGHMPIISRTTLSNTGFSVVANVNVLSSGGQSNITSPVTFDWIAVGTVEIA